jgi:hypothetical protein
MKRLLFAVLLMLVFWASSAWGDVVRTTTYWFTSDKVVTVAWGAPDGSQMGDVFEVKVQWVETGHEWAIGTTPELQIDITAPRVGHFDVYVRTKRPVDGGDPLYSEWIVSTDQAVATVDGNPEGWRIYWRMASPGTVVIGNNYFLEGKEKKNANQGENHFVGAFLCARLGRVSGLLETNRDRRRRG